MMIAVAVAIAKNVTIIPKPLHASTTSTPPWLRTMR